MCSIAWLKVRKCSVTLCCTHSSLHAPCAYPWLSDPVPCRLLGAQLKMGKLPPLTCLGLGCSLCDGLHAAHVRVCHTGPVPQLWLSHLRAVNTYCVAAAASTTLDTNKEHGSPATATQCCCAASCHRSAHDNGKDGCAPGLCQCASKGSPGLRSPPHTQHPCPRVPAPPLYQAAPPSPATLS